MSSLPYLAAFVPRFFAHPKILRIVTDAPLREGECAGEWPGPPLIVEAIDIVNSEMEGDFATGLDLVGIDLLSGVSFPNGGVWIMVRGILLIF